MNHEEYVEYKIIEKKMADENPIKKNLLKILENSSIHGCCFKWNDGSFVKEVTIQFTEIEDLSIIQDSSKWKQGATGNGAGDDREDKDNGGEGG
jgi:hypothetical protein